MMILLQSRFSHCSTNASLKFTSPPELFPSTMAFITPLPIYNTVYSTQCNALTPLRPPVQYRSTNLHICVPLCIPAMDARGQGIYSEAASPSNTRVVIFGATGYIGRYVVFEFIKQRYQVVAFSRERSGVKGKNTKENVRKDLKGASVVFGDVTDPLQVSAAFQHHPSQPKPLSTIVVSCLASRSGGIHDSQRIDYEATLNVLTEARKAAASHFILLSAICVQKPLLEFQRAKLRFEEQLQTSAEQDPNFSYSIVRPTAFFKSLAAQVERVKKGSAYIMFGDGALSKCNALSEADLAKFMVLCASDPEKRNQILPVGGPGSAVTPKDQAQILFRLLEKKPKYQSLPIGLMTGAIRVLDFFANFLPFMKDPAEFGKIGKYYAVEDMVGPSFGSDTLEDFFAKAIQEGGLDGQDLGDAAIF